MAHTKAQGSSSNGRDSAGQRLGVKRYGGQIVNAGEVIVRQNGTKFAPGLNVGLGSNDTLFSFIPGIVKFEFTSKTPGRWGGRRKVSVYPVAAAKTPAKAKAKA